MPTQGKNWLAGHQAVIICLGWAIWDGLTAAAYLDKSPPQLERVENFLHMPIWIVWAIATTLLVIGAFIPVRLGERFRNVAIIVRGAGLAVTAVGLGLWGIEFMFADAARGWVTGKNYLMLGLCAVFFGYLSTRYTVREE